MIPDAEKSHDLPCVSQGTRKAGGVIRLSPKAEDWKHGHRSSGAAGRLSTSRESKFVLAAAFLLYLSPQWIERRPPASSNDVISTHSTNPNANLFQRYPHRGTQKLCFTSYLGIPQPSQGETIRLAIELSLRKLLQAPCESRGSEEGSEGKAGIGGQQLLPPSPLPTHIQPQWSPCWTPNTPGTSPPRALRLRSTLSRHLSSAFLISFISTQIPMTTKHKIAPFPTVAPPSPLILPSFSPWYLSLSDLIYICLLPVHSLSSPLCPHCPEKGTQYEYSVNIWVGLGWGG